LAVIDWFSRYVLSWDISITLESSFCLEALDRALGVATPEIFNTDQGVQFTSAEFTNRLKAAAIRISWDGRGRALDNIFVERLWRSVKYEEVYIKDYQTVLEAVQSLNAYFEFYNHERLHQALDYQTPATVYWGTRQETGGNFADLSSLKQANSSLSYFSPPIV
jgi:putative transposase